MFRIESLNLDLRVVVVRNKKVIKVVAEGSKGGNLDQVSVALPVPLF